jgi:hypothetical protein
MINALKYDAFLDCIANIFLVLYGDILRIDRRFLKELFPKIQNMKYSKKGSLIIFSII